MAFSVYLFRYPEMRLAGETCKSKYGALYEDVRRSKPAVLTSAFHNFRLFLLVPMLVFLAPYPLAQSVSYVAFSMMGFAWDFVVWPYEGRVLTIQTLFLDFAKIVAGVGYVLMTAQSVSTAVAEWAGNYEFVAFLAAIAGGLVLSLVEGAYEIAVTVREWCRNKGKDKVASISDVSVVDISQGTVVTHAN